MLVNSLQENEESNSITFNQTEWFNLLSTVLIPYMSTLTDLYVLKHYKCNVLYWLGLFQNNQCSEEGWRDVKWKEKVQSNFLIIFEEMNQIALELSNYHGEYFQDHLFLISIVHQLVRIIYGDESVTEVRWDCSTLVDLLERW